MPDAERPASGLARWASLLYLLASTYLVARLLLNRLLLGTWGVSPEMLAHVVLVASAQTVVVELVRLVATRRRGRNARPEVGH